MNIIWIYNRPLNPESGGTERITSLIAKGLSQKGQNCMGMLVFDEESNQISYNGVEITELYNFLKERHIDVVINQIAYSKWLLEAFLNNGGGQWRQEGGRIISCLHFDPQNPSYLYYLKRKSNKNLKEYINLVRVIIFHKYYERIQQKQEGETYNYIYDNSDWFVALSKTHFPYLHKVMCRKEYSKLVAINNPLTFDEISGLDILSEKKKMVLVCARMSEYHKRISLILKAWKMLQKNDQTSDWQLVLLGDGTDLNRYKDYVQAKHIRNVKFEGQQSPEPYYHDASILLLTSSAEGWGLTITEGLQRAVVPVVMESCPVFREIIVDGENGFLTPNGDVRRFAEKIELLIHNPKLLKEMQEKALNSSEAFSIKKTMGKWENLIKDLSTIQDDFL